MTKGASKVVWKLVGLPLHFWSFAAMQEQLKMTDQYAIVCDPFFFERVWNVLNFITIFFRMHQTMFLQFY
jgi:hypothetical protein